MAERKDLVARFFHWAVWAIVIGIVLYVGGTIWAGASDVSDHLRGFHWGIYGVVLLLTLVNYGLRFLKWHYLLKKVGVHVSLWEDALIYLAGLSMVISPGKAGELLKPYLITRKTQTPMATTLPVLITERLTDGIAMLALAAISVSTYASDKVLWIAIPSGLVVAGLLVLASERLSMLILTTMGQLPYIKKIADKLIEMYQAMRKCLAPGPFIVTMLLSMVAWWAECLGYQLIFLGLGEEVSLDAATFLYAFATVAGGAMPGGLGIADGALAGGAVTILGVTESIAVTAAVLVRVATLWFGVILGAFALLHFANLVKEGLPLKEPEEPSPSSDPS